MGLELMLGFDNKKESSHGVQIGFKNESSYPHHVLQMGLYNKNSETGPNTSFVGVKVGVVNYDENSMWGAHVGLLSNTKQLRGLQLSVLNTSDEMYGIQAGALSATFGYGVQAGFMNLSGEFTGLQAGVINSTFRILGNKGKSSGKVRGVQVGAWNYARDLDGVQAGLVNYVKEELDGLQLGALNIAGDEFNGVQVGLVCYAANGNYLQLGLLTFRGGERDWYKKFSPIIGFSANGKKEEAKLPEPQGSTKHGTDL